MIQWHHVAGIQATVFAFILVRNKHYCVQIKSTREYEMNIEQFGVDERLKW